MTRRSSSATPRTSSTDDEGKGITLEVCAAHSPYLPAAPPPLRTAHHAPRTMHCAHRTPHHAPRTTHHAPRTTHLALLTTRHTLHTTYLQVLLELVGQARRPHTLIAFAERCSAAVASRAPASKDTATAT